MLKFILEKLQNSCTVWIFMIILMECNVGVFSQNYRNNRNNNLDNNRNNQYQNSYQNRPNNQYQPETNYAYANSVYDSSKVGRKNVLPYNSMVIKPNGYINSTAELPGNLSERKEYIWVP